MLIHAEAMRGPMSHDHISQFHAEGYAVVRGVFDDSEVTALADSFDRIRADAMAHGRSWRHNNIFYRLADDQALGRIVRYAQWAAWIDDTLEQTRRDKRLLEILEPLIGRDIKQIINQLHWKPPGAAMAEFGFHQDSRSRHPRAAYRDLAASYIQTGIAVDPHSEANGAVVLCPRSHLLGELPYDVDRHSMNVNLNPEDLRRFGVDPDDAVTVDMAPGDVALWHVHMLHGSGPNRARIDRRLYINGYVIADNCDRGEWAFRDGVPCPLEGEPALVHYEDLHEKPGPMYVD
jgi:ectoine hydroxylase-related dioxygenase (phytanoyl-CoA dioxygenase family)